MRQHNRFRFLIAVFFLLTLFGSVLIAADRLDASPSDGPTDSSALEASTDAIPESEPEERVSYCAARIESIKPLTGEEAREVFGGTDPFYAAYVSGKIIDPPHSGEAFTSLHLVQDSIDHFRISPGDKVIVMVEEDRQGKLLAANILEYDRRSSMIWLLLVFLGAVWALGRMTGLRSLVALGFTVAAVFFYFIPSVARGGNPSAGAFAVCIFSTVLTLICIGGFERKYLAAIFGTLGGVASSFMLAWFFNGLMRLTGSMSHETRMLYIQLGKDFDYAGLLLAGIIIGALGAIMDVSVSIASALSEVCQAGGGKMGFKELVASGLAIGRDIMGTMTNTLILAYVGGSLPLLVLLVAQKTDYPFAKLLNFDLIASEVLRSLVGSLGLIMAIPLTALAAGILMAPRPESSREQ